MTKKDHKLVIDPKTGLKIDPSKDHELNDFSKTLLSKFYLKENETPQQGFARAAKAWAVDDEHGQRLLDAVSKGWFMFASPVLSNAPEVETLNPLKFKGSKGLPISCFLGKVEDTLESLIDHTSELRWLSVLGGGVGGHWREVRPASDKAPGTIPFLHTVDADMEAYKQGRVRRGSYAAYMDISHPDIPEFINIRVPTGDASRKAHSTGFHHGVNITDAFMEAVDKNLDWDLIDPHSGEVRQTVSARTLWEQILEIRYRTGEPYLYFIDTAQRALPEIQQKMGLKTNGSNLCLVGDTEIRIRKDGHESTIRLDEFVEKFKNGDTDYEVRSYDVNTSGYCWSKVSAAAMTGTTKELIRIEMDSGKVIECTPEHQIFTSNRGFVKASELLETDILVDENLG